MFTKIASIASAALIAVSFAVVADAEAAGCGGYATAPSYQSKPSPRLAAQRQAAKRAQARQVASAKRYEKKSYANVAAKKVDKPVVVADASTAPTSAPVTDTAEATAPVTPAPVRIAEATVAATEATVVAEAPVEAQKTCQKFFAQVGTVTVPCE